MTGKNGVERYWRSSMSKLEPGDSPPKSYDSGHFGDTEELANKLAELVRTGGKTSTSSLVWTYEAEGWKRPVARDVVVVTDWGGRPSCIIEVTEVAVRPFGEIDERFAYEYREGDGTLKWWREANVELLLRGMQEIGP